MNENEIREYALMKATFKWLLIGMLWQDAIAKIIRNTSCHVCICTSWHWNTEYIRTFRSEGSQINWQD